ncbi:MAG TPA: hypothetical protein VIC71_01140 [Gammaproteobacteria bacterium]|jgi:hypothetical protein
MRNIDPAKAVAAAALMAAFVALLPNRARADGLIVSAGTEVDDESGYLLYAGVGGNFAERTSWDLAAGHADTSRDFTSLTTTSYDFGVRHDFGSVALRFGIGGWEDSDLVTTEKLAAALDFHGEGWSFALQSEFRDSAFEPFDIDRTITLRDGTTYTITARADCDIDDTGLGARLRLSNDSWAWTLGSMSYDYDDPECGFNLRALDFLRRSTRDEFIQFADRLTTVLSYAAGTNLIAENSFLDSRLGTSLSYTGAIRTYNVYFDHLEEAFFGLASDTLSGGMTFPVGKAYELELYVGVTESDAFSNIAFLGLSMLFVR